MKWFALVCLVGACGGNGAEVDASPSSDAAPQPGDVSWAMRAGSVREDSARAVAALAGGGLAVGGGFGLIADFGAGTVLSEGDRDAFVAAYDDAGELTWVQTFGGYILDIARVHGVASAAADELAIAGWFWGSLPIGEELLESAGSADAFVARLGAAGSPVWARSFGAGQIDNLTGVGLDSDGAVVAAGYFEGVVDFGDGDGDVTASAADAVVVKYAGADGAPLWATAFGGSDNDYVWDVAIAAGDAVAVAGTFAFQVDFGCEVITDNGLADAFVMVLDGQSGACSWVRRIGSGQVDQAFAVAADSSGDVVVAGTFQGTADFGGVELTAGGSPSMFVARYDSDGALVWAKRFGGSGPEVPWAVEFDAAGNILFTGSFSGDISFGGVDLIGEPAGDMFVVKLSGDGSHLWSKRFTGQGEQVGYAVTSSPSAGVIVAGEFEESILVGREALSADGDSDAVWFTLLP